MKNENDETCYSLAASLGNKAGGKDVTFAKHYYASYR